MKNKISNKFWTWVFAVICITLFCFAGRQLAYMGNASGADTANISGSLRLTKQFYINDTFTTKSGDFIRLQRDSVTVTRFDSAGRLSLIPEVIVNSTRDGSNKLIVGGTAKITGNAAIGASGSNGTLIRSDGILLGNSVGTAIIRNYSAITGLWFGAVEGGGGGFPIYMRENDVTYAYFSSTGMMYSNTTITGPAVIKTNALVEFRTTTKFIYLHDGMTAAMRDAVTPAPSAGAYIYCTDCTATDGSTGVGQTYNGTTWKNHW